MGAGHQLYHLGSLRFRVTPFGLGETGHDITADWVAKEVIGTRRPREFVGLGDERMTLSGTLYPEALGGGMGSLERLKTMQQQGVPYPLVRGDGKHMRLYAIERLSQDSTHLSRYGYGKQIDYVVSLIRMPKPKPGDFVKSILRLFA